MIPLVNAVAKREEIIKEAFDLMNPNVLSTMEGIESMRSILPIKTKTMIEKIIASFNS